jgi:creatinine amidohydrolase
MQYINSPKLEYAVDTKPQGFLPKDKAQRHIDAGGDVYQRPIPGHAQVGLSGLEVSVYPEGVIGKPSIADGSKAKEGLETLLDYIVERSLEEIEEVLKGPFHGGRHIYTIAYPP